jgi:hypothetical protein
MLRYGVRAGDGMLICWERNILADSSGAITVRTVEEWSGLIMLMGVREGGKAVGLTQMLGL